MSHFLLFSSVTWGITVHVFQFSTVVAYKRWYEKVILNLNIHLRDLVLRLQIALISLLTSAGKELIVYGKLNFSPVSDSIQRFFGGLSQGCTL